MSSYQAFTVTRTTEPDSATLLAQLRALDPSAGIGQHTPGTTGYVLVKATAWTAPQMALAQTVLDTAPATTPQLDAQAAIDAMPVFDKAIVLTILDQFNVVRAALPTPLPAINVPQMIASIRTKAGTL